MGSEEGPGAPLWVKVREEISRLRVSTLTLTWPHIDERSACGPDPIGTTGGRDLPSPLERLTELDGDSGPLTVS